jgi:hypothetical protein
LPEGFDTQGVEFPNAKPDRLFVDFRQIPGKLFSIVGFSNNSSEA